MWSFCIVQQRFQLKTIYLVGYLSGVLFVFVLVLFYTVLLFFVFSYYVIVLLFFALQKTRGVKPNSDQVLKVGWSKYVWCHFFSDTVVRVLVRIGRQRILIFLSPVYREILKMSGSAKLSGSAELVKAVFCY